MENEIMNEIEQEEVMDFEPTVEVSEKKDHSGTILGVVVGAAATVLGIKTFGFIKKKLADRKEKKLASEESIDEKLN